MPMGKNKGTKKKRPSESEAGGPLDAQNLRKADLNAGEVITPPMQSNKIIICKQGGCHDISTTHGYCRFHYLASWRSLKSKEAKRHGQELKLYLAELSRKFPEEFLERLKGEVEDLIEKEKIEESDDSTDRSMFDSAEGGDEDMDTIIKGLKVEDY